MSVALFRKPLSKIAKAILRRYTGSLWAPSPATCFSDSAGTTPAVKDGQVGRIVCSTGSGIYASQATTGYMPKLRKGAKNWLLNSATLSTQSVTVPAVAMTLSIYGTGSVVLSGTGSGTLNGTGESNRVSLTFTPTAGSCTFTVSGSVTSAMLEIGSTASPYVATTSAPASNGVGNWWLDFDGVDDRLILSAVPFQMTDSSFVVAGILASKPALNGMVYSQFGSGTARAQLYVDASGTLFVGVNDDSGTSKSVFSPGSNIGVLAIGAMRKTSSTVTVRKNATQETPQAYTPGTATFVGASIGSNLTAPTNFFYGSIYAIALGKGAITYSELKLVEKYLGSLSGVQIP